MSDDLHDQTVEAVIVDEDGEQIEVIEGDVKYDGPTNRRERISRKVRSILPFL